MSAAQLPSDLGVTAGPVDDFDELYEFVRSVNIAQSGRAFVSREFLEAMLSMPDFDQEAGVRFVRDSAGRLVAVGWLQTRRPFIETFVRGFVSPDRLNEGIGTLLLDWQLGTARRHVEKAPDGARVVAHTDLDPAHSASVELVGDWGFSVERYFLEMRIDFDGTPQAPPQPLASGLRLVGFDPESDLERLFDATTEAFQDHYGYVDRPREDELARFTQFMSIPTFDPTLVWMVLDGDEIAGAITCIGNHEGDAQVGYVASLGVRRPWRGRGLAKTMLHVCFAEFASREKTAVTLHVDAANPTGATHLYESVGMREIHRSATYVVELRPGENLAVS